MSVMVYFIFWQWDDRTKVSELLLGINHVAN